MTITRTPDHDSKPAASNPHRTAPTTRGKASFFDKTGIVRTLVWGNCLNISSSSFIIIGLSGSAEAELVKNNMGLCTLLYQTCAVLFFAANTMPQLIPVKKHDTTYCAVVRASDGAYWLASPPFYTAGQRGDSL